MCRSGHWNLQWQEGKNNRFEREMENLQLKERGDMDMESLTGKSDISPPRAICTGQMNVEAITR